MSKLVWPGVHESLKAAKVHSTIYMSAGVQAGKELEVLFIKARSVQGGKACLSRHTQSREARHAYQGTLSPGRQGMLIKAHSVQGGKARHTQSREARHAYQGTLSPGRQGMLIKAHSVQGGKACLSRHTQSREARHAYQGTLSPGRQGMFVYTYICTCYSTNVSLLKQGKVTQHRN